MKYPGDVVLVVDDDECYRELMRQTIEEHFGISTSLARNGTEALQRVESLRPVLVLLDMMMPELNGIEVLRHLKKNAATSAIPVIGVSASTSYNWLLRSAVTNSSESLSSSMLSWPK